MNVGIVLPGFSASERDWAIPVQANLARTLAQTDDVRILALRYPHRRDRYAAFGAQVTSLGWGQARGMRRLVLWFDALLALVRLHRERPFDVLHAMWADETGLIAAWAGRYLRVPVVVSLLGGELTKLDDIGYGLQRGRFSRWTVGQALKWADVILAPGTYAAAAITKAGYTIPAQKLRVAPLGVDTRLFSPDETPRIPNRLLHVASLVPVKDQATLLRAVARLDDVTLDVVGDGPERAALERQAEALGIARRVQFLGSIPHEELPACYHRASLHVMASRSEALPIALLEAAACGLFTVATAVGAMPDYPDLAQVVAVGDDVAFAGAIRHMLYYPDELWERSQKALETARHDFGIKVAAERVRTIYEELKTRRRS